MAIAVAQVSRCVRMEPPESPYVSLRCLQPQRSVALGMSVEYEVTFCSDTDDDYACDLIVATERERFVLPLYATGAHLQLDVPEVIDCGKAPVKATVTRSYVLTNVGRKRGSFRLTADGDFAVRPAQGTLDVDASVQCAITFAPRSDGQSNGTMTVLYATGAEDIVELRGVGQDLGIFLPQRTLEMAPVYITQSTTAAFSIANPSAVCVRFRGYLSSARTSVTVG